MQAGSLQLVPELGPFIIQEEGKNRMNRRDFVKNGSKLAIVASLGAKAAQGFVPAHNWGKYDFGSGPTVSDRLDQGPFAQYPPDATIPVDDVVMTTTPSRKVVPNYGMGLVTYLNFVYDRRAIADTAEINSANISKLIEDLVEFPLGQKLYIRPTWREIQPRRGRLDFPDYLKLVFDLARKNNKRIGFRIQMSAPEYFNHPALPDFVLEKVPLVKLVGDWKPGNPPDLKWVRNPYSNYQPRYDNPFFLQAFTELIGLLAEEFNGNPLIEFVDTFMYGFWGEGHTWPFISNPFPDCQTAERTWIQMLNIQLEHFTKSPLLTNTQPDFSRVGNSEVLDRTVRSNNWIRSDTIFVENEQIEALSNRPPWVAVAIEQGIPGKPPQSLPKKEGISPTQDIIAHVVDVGANYFSLWLHDISPENLVSYCKSYPTGFDWINRRIGYRVRPSLIWAYSKDEYLGLIVGFANDGIAGVPGVLRVIVESPEGVELKSGCLDPGHPLPGKIRQAQLVLPRGTKLPGLRLKAEIEVKGMRYPVQWACQQRLNDDGSLELNPSTRNEGEFLPYEPPGPATQSPNWVWTKDTGRICPKGYCEGYKR